MVNKRLTQKSLHHDPFVQKILARIPTQIAATFTDAQLTELKKVFIDRVSNSSKVDMRLSIPFFKRRFYLVLLMGKENRSQQRLKNSNFKVVNGYLATIYSLVIMSFFLGMLYYVEKELEINAFPYKQLQHFNKSFKR
ncbi:hypothetical protein H6G54_05685 [Anabaena cylindrica FACHB-243]|uniref:Uncharacterized protein n=1 Tax=Anabaena cylindrica (strain ATCC 27899 / PCC 7122) TaxID=272123 RepID=K9ZLZ8_ANACC|nr:MULTISPECIES: hypothetical protein [Anabaena]AFZ59809.1 hypothetical protein Anacy_4451 [Anabaena cylindrica PCC 7122]MBD2417210.1 hypothetical protein [Anabaena cylindrica FACHB-243]MBY5282294.1 hypothetical protein [Anabaena sp. CCAP 1446/1C]MBY5309780.1 hypothetical protein [Anabaena sp. CCAP 1446/1C]MCM2404974.1 hypothetical protein [Anabaena sp. CCAP 1446/1C]